MDDFAMRDAGSGRGLGLLRDPMRNRGTAFSRDERRRLGLEGLLPHQVESLELQV